MQVRAIHILFIATAICTSAAAQEKYTIQEKCYVGQKSTFTVNNQYHAKYTVTKNGKSSNTDGTSGLIWKVTLTILETKDGLATHAQADVDPTSVDTLKVNGHEMTQTPCPYAGRSVLILQHKDGSFTNNFAGDAPDDDRKMLNNFLAPNNDYYPDAPVAVGSVWDVSAKVAKHSPLGPKDKLTSQSKLDWVKTIDGKQIAQISNTTHCMYYEAEGIQEDATISATMLVDIASGGIIKYHENGTSKCWTPPKQAMQLTGSTESSFDSEVLAEAGGADATTKP